jgi:uncharacterized membrane protein HdeD (DUF308 family)
MNSKTDVTAFNKMAPLPIAVQGLLGFALLVFGVIMMCYSTFWAQGDDRWLIAFLSIGTLFLLSGIFPMIESVMTMTQDKPKE